MSKDSKYPWQEQDLYQPDPIESQRARVTLGVFAWLCVLAAVCGVLWAVSN